MLAVFTPRRNCASTTRGPLAAGIAGAFILLGSGPALAQTYSTYVLEPTADTYVTDSASTTNYGSSIGLLTQRHASGNYRTALRWDFSSIVSGSRLVSASVQFGIGNAQNATVGIYRVGVNWSESTATWTNTGGMTPNATASATFSSTTANTVQNVTLTTLVDQWLRGSIVNTGVVLVPTTSQNTQMQIASREYSTASARPLLTLTMLPPPALVITRSSTVMSDPIQGVTTPKRIPGAVLSNGLATENRSSGYPDANTVVLNEAIVANSMLFVNDLGAAGSGPITFTQGSPSSGVTFTYASLASTTDDVSFSNDGGVTYAYTPVPDANGYDGAVTHLRINPKGTFAGEAGAGYPSFALAFRTKLK